MTKTDRRPCVAAAMIATMGLTAAAVRAHAQAPNPPATPAPGERKEPAAPPGPTGEMPKPAPELAKLDWLKGNWRCDGKAPEGALGPGSPASTYKSSVKFGRTLDGYWVSMDYEQKKSKTRNFAIKAHGLINWDAGGKKFMAWGFDSMGGVSVVTATAEDGTWAATGEQIMGSQRIPYRESFTRGTDNLLTLKGEMKTGADWTTVFEDTCKK